MLAPTPNAQPGISPPKSADHNITQQPVLDRHLFRLPDRTRQPILLQKHFHYTSQTGESQLFAGDINRPTLCAAMW